MNCETGTRTELGRRWTSCGFRPTGEQIIGYEFGYLSVALNPASGELFALILPDMTVESFQAFIDEFSNIYRQAAQLCAINHGRGRGASQHSIEDCRAIET